MKLLIKKLRQQKYQQYFVLSYKSFFTSFRLKWKPLWFSSLFNTFQVNNILCIVPQQNICRNLWEEIQLFKHFYIFYNTDKYQGVTLILLGVISKKLGYSPKIEWARDKKEIDKQKVLIEKSIRTLFVELRRLELLTLCLQSRCATSCAIAPLEKKNKMLNFVGPGGLEPPTSSLSGMRSNHLSYGPNLYVENIQVVRLAHETKMSNSKSKRVAKLFYKITLNDCA